MAHRVTLIPGDGIGPELAEASRRVLDATGVAFEWEVVDAGKAVMAEYGPRFRPTSWSRSGATRSRSKARSRRRSARGSRSVNVTLRQELGLYANLRPARSIKGLETRYEDVDLVIVRENTEDLYAGIEHMVGPDAAESIKIITRAASERIARSAFDYAVANGRRKVTAVHKANIMKPSDGLFLESCRTVAADYDGKVEFEDRIVDNMCMQLVQKPDSMTCWCCRTCTATSSATWRRASSAGWAWPPAPTSARTPPSSSRSTAQRPSTRASTRRTRRR